MSRAYTSAVGYKIAVRKQPRPAKATASVNCIIKPREARPMWAQWTKAFSVLVVMLLAVIAVEGAMLIAATTAVYRNVGNRVECGSRSDPCHVTGAVSINGQ
jgi:hypothetical protein